jgi:hypothetical protein
MSDDLLTKITGSIVEGEPDETPELMARQQEVEAAGTMVTLGCRPC